MYVDFRDSDTAEERALKELIAAEWDDYVRLKKLTDEALARHAKARASLRLLTEGLVEGEKVTLFVSATKGYTGVVELATDVPYLWVRLVKDGVPSKRRMALNEGARILKADGSAPIPLHKPDGLATTVFD